MILEKITLKFENELYFAEVPIREDFTGQVILIFHWKNGDLMKSEVHKNSSVAFQTEISTTDSLQNENKEV